MPRRGHQCLHVWMNRPLVGYWQFSERTGHRFTYDAAWLQSPLCRPLSLSLSLRPAHDHWQGPRVGRFFDNLLPEHPLQRQRLRLHVGAASSSAFDLLAQVGLDCPGALQFSHHDAPPPPSDPHRAQPLSAQELEALIGALRHSPSQMGGAGPLAPIALAGSHDKTALLWHQGQWHLPGQGILSSHLLKLPLERHQDSGFALTGSVENAWLCQRVAQAFGVPMPACEMLHIGAQRVLAVARVDRSWHEDSQHWQGVPLEDMCQAHGLAPEMKYQINGACSASSMAQILLGSVSAAEDRITLLRTLLVFWLLCVFDAHAKNFLLYLLPGGRFRLAPTLSVLSAHPLLGSGAGKLSPDAIRPALGLADDSPPPCWRSLDGGQWLAHARACALPRAEMTQMILDLTAKAVPVSAQLRKQLPAGFPVAVAEPILQGVVHAARRLRESL